MYIQENKYLSKVVGLEIGFAYDDERWYCAADSLCRITYGTKTNRKVT